MTCLAPRNDERVTPAATERLQGEIRRLGADRHAAGVGCGVVSGVFGAEGCLSLAGSGREHQAGDEGCSNQRSHPNPPQGLTYKVPEPDLGR